jgi:hypothetical protein
VIVAAWVPAWAGAAVDPAALAAVGAGALAAVGAGALAAVGAGPLAAVGAGAFAPVAGGPLELLPPPWQAASSDAEAAPSPAAVANRTSARRESRADHGYRSLMSFASTRR